MKTKKNKLTFHRSPSALLICDMLNPLDFPEGRMLYPKAVKAALAIAKFKKRLKENNIPVIYANDNFGQWQSDWKTLYSYCLSENVLGHKLAEILQPESDDYFVLKPKHSAFYSTTLEILLRQMGVQNLFITGIAGNICVLFTAHDAYMRDFKVSVPKDCMASNTLRAHRSALQQLEVFDIKTTTSSRIRNFYLK